MSVSISTHKSAREPAILRGSFFKETLNVAQHCVCVRAVCVRCSSAIDHPYFHSSPLLFLVVKLSAPLWLIKGVKRLRCHNRVLI